ncbi:zinc finger, CCHC-type containing protein, partial [Tanacetum coccineum]
LGNHQRIEESLRAQDNDKPKGNNVVGPQKNLVPSSILNNCGYKQVIESNTFVLYKHGVFIGFGYLINQMFKLNIVNDNIASAFMSTSKLNDSILWHPRLDHVHFKRMQDMSKDGLIPAFDMDTEKLIYDGALDKFKVFKNEVELQQGSLIKRFRINRGGEYMDTLYFQSVGIIHETTALYTPQQNGERGIECIFVGYAEHSKTFRLYVIEPNDSVSIYSIIESRDAIFDENRFSSVPRPSLGIPNGTEDIGGSVVPKEATEEDDPKTFDEAMKSQDVVFWKEAINDEMDSIIGNNTWVLADLPPSCKPLGVPWKNINDFPYEDPLNSCGMFSNRALHWVTVSDDSPETQRIVSLDLAKETYGEVLLFEYDEGDTRLITLGVSGEWLCGICCYHSRYADLWVMKVYGVKDSWTKLVSFPYLMDERIDEYSVPLCREACIVVESLVSPFPPFALVHNSEIKVSISPHSNFPMANFSAKYSIMTQEMVDSFCESFYIPAEVHPTAPGRDKTIAQFPADMGLLDFIKTADPRKVRAMEVQKGDDQVTLLESTRHCFMPLVIPAAGGSGSVTATGISALTERGQENVAEENAYLELADPDEGTTMARQSDEEVVAEQPKKTKKKRLTKQSDVLPAKRLRTDHPSLAFGTEESESFVDLSAQASLKIRTTVGSSSTLGVAADTAAATTTSTKAKFTVDLATLYPAEAKRWSRAEHELELKEKLNAKYAALGKLLEKKDSKILRLKSQLAEKEAETAKVVRLRDQVSSLSIEKSALTAEVSALKVACTEAGTKITSLSSERDRLVSEVSSLLAGFKDFKERMEVQQEEQAQELYNHVAELEAHVMDVSGRLEGEFYPTYLTLLAGKRWLLTHGIQLALLKCLKSLEYQGILGHALGRAIDFGMQEGLEVGDEHGVAGRSLSAVDAYNPKVASANYVNAVRALEDAYFPLVDLLKSKKDAEMDEVLDYFLLDGPLAELPKAASLQPCIEQLSIPIHHA